MGKGTSIVLRLALLVAWAVVPACAGAQSLEAPNRAPVIEAIAKCDPDLLHRDHEFTDVSASVLHESDPAWGRNGKRGNVNDPSHDAIAYRNPAGPGGVSIVDIIGGAGGPRPSAAWIDQTRATIDGGTIGAWLAPSGRVPAHIRTCLEGGGDGGTAPGQGPGGPVGPTPTPSPALEALRADVARLEGAVGELLGRVSLLLEVNADANRRLDAMSARAEELADRQIRRIFGVLVEGDGTMPAGIAEEAVNRLYERTARGDRLRVKAW